MNCGDKSKSSSSTKREISYKNSLKKIESLRQKHNKEVKSLSENIKSIWRSNI